LVKDERQFFLLSASENDYLLKNGQKRLENNHLAMLV